MADARNEFEKSGRKLMLFDGVSPMSQSEMRGIAGGARGTLYEEWLAICKKYPDSAPCKGRH